LPIVQMDPRKAKLKDAIWTGFAQCRDHKQ
jgi:hypothetical protein